jgi:peptide/nickel transport system ATP-binding protein
MTNPGKTHTRAPLLKVRDLSVTFLDKNFKALDNISFDLPKGSSLGVVGESGSGKSLTCKSILNLLSYNRGCRTTGKVLYSYDGNEIDLLSEDEAMQEEIRGRKIAYVAQEPMNSFNPIMTCKKQLHELLTFYHGMEQEKIESEQSRLLRLAGLDDPDRILDSLPHEISGGQAQRVSLAFALSGNPELLICDEPTTALDTSTQKDIIETLHSLQVDSGLSLLFVSHDLNLVAGLCEYIVVLKDGRIVEKGPTEKILRSPEHEYTSKLIKIQRDKNRYLVQEGMSNRSSAPEDEIMHDDDRIQDSGNNSGVVLTDVSVSYTIDPWYTMGRKRKLEALKDISCTIPAEGITGIVGESGSGKSTLGRCIAGIQSWENGSIFLNGQGLSTNLFSRSPGLRRSVQIIFQDPSSALNPRMNILDAVAEAVPDSYIRQTGRPSLDRAKELMVLVQLDKDVFYRRPGTLSGGQRQRTCIARSFILDLLKRLQRELSLQIIFISHDLSAVSYLCDEVLVLNEGRIIEQGRTSEVLRDPSNSYTRQLLSNMPAPMQE